jgi:hypothetical protein
MKKFLIQTGLFFTIIIAVNIAFFLIAKKYYFNDYASMPPKQFKSFLLADSHGIILKNNTQSYGIYNFSNSGDSYRDLYRKLLFLVANNKVDTIYITAGNHTLSNYRELSNNADRSVIYSSIKEYNNPIEYISDKYIQHYWVLFAPKARIIITRYISGKWKKLWNKNYNYKTVNNIKPWLQMNSQERKAACIDRAQSQFGNPIPSLSLQDYLERIITICKTNSITLIGLKFPLTNDYVNCISGKDLGADKVLIDNGFLVLDFSNKYVKQDSLFENQDHLNDLGGAIFTKEWLANSK